MPVWLIPAIISAVGIGADILKQKAAGKPQEDQARLYNEWLASRQTGVDDILKKLGENGYNPFGPQTTTSNSSGRSSSTSVTNSSSSTKSSQKPVVTAEYKKLEGMFRGLLEGRLARPSALPSGYAERGVRTVNDTYRGSTAAARNMAARRGLSGEATFGLAMPSETARAGKIADFLVDVPLKERALQTEDIQLAAQLAQIFGLGSEMMSNTTGTSTTKSSGTSSMSGSNTSPPNLGALANFLLPPGPQQSGQSGQSALGTGAAGISQLLAWLYQQGMIGGGKGKSGKFSS